MHEFLGDDIGGAELAGCHYARPESAQALSDLAITIKAWTHAFCRLIEEVNTVPLFGGRRAVWVKAGGRNIASAVEPLLAAPAPDCRVVIEAGDLKRSAPLRAICERSKHAVALPCYPDAERDLVRLIDAELRAESLAISAEARSARATVLPVRYWCCYCGFIIRP